MKNLLMGKLAVLSSFGAFLICAGLFFLLPTNLEMGTDVLGYPTHASFLIDRYYWFYYLVVLFSLLSVGGFLLLCRFRPINRRSAEAVPLRPAILFPEGVTGL